MNTLRFFTPAVFTPSVFKTLPENVFDHFLINRKDETNFDGYFNGDPHTNIIEEGDKFRVELALPGYSKEQINMKYHEDILTVSAEVENSTKEGVKFISHEFGLKSFSKRFSIPQTLDRDSISAEFTNGILLITILKKEEVRKKEPIEVQIN